MATLERPDDNNSKPEHSNDPLIRMGASLSLEQQLKLRHYKDQIEAMPFTFESFTQLQQLLYQAFRLNMCQSTVAKSLMKKDIEEDWAKAEKELGMSPDPGAGI